MDYLQSYPIQNGVYYLSPLEEVFESAYLKIREKEQRIYSDQIVTILPSYPTSDSQKEEWAVRALSTNRLINHLPETAIDILDLGCGNGWFTRHLIKEHNRVLGLDINKRELEQGSRLFRSDRCQFAYGDVYKMPQPTYFDVITINSCLQYFQSLSDILSLLRQWLKPNGRIHIIDSPFYMQKDISAAQKRTEAYYTEKGIPEMIDFYFHHSYEEIQKFNPTFHYHPDHFLQRIKRKFITNDSPFPWLSIKSN